MKTLKNMSIDTSLLQSKIYDLVIKTILSIEPQVVSIVRKLALGRNNCFDLLGFDVMIDSNLKPWLLEVNLSPSLATDSPLDLHIKSNLIADTLNLVGVRYFDRKKESMNKLRARIRARKNQTKNFDGKIKGGYKNELSGNRNFNKYKNAIIDAVEEVMRLKNFVRIYPAAECEVYDKFFVMQRPSNKALYNYLFVEKTDEPILFEISEIVKKPEKSDKKSETEKKIELDSENTLKNSETDPDKDPEKKKLIITGDDILIEYLSRVLHALKSISYSKLKSD